MVKVCKSYCNWCGEEMGDRGSGIHHAAVSMDVDPGRDPVVQELKDVLNLSNCLYSPDICGLCLGTLRDATVPVILSLKRTMGRLKKRRL